MRSIVKKPGTKDMSCAAALNDTAATFPEEILTTTHHQGDSRTKRSNKQRSLKRKVAIIAGCFTIVVVVVVLVLIRGRYRACAPTSSCAGEPKQLRGNATADEGPNDHNNDPTFIEDEEDSSDLYFNVGGKEITEWELSDEGSIFQSDRSDARVIRLCDNEQNMMCTARSGHLIYSFTDLNEDSPYSHIHLYFVRDDTIRRYQIIVDGQLILEEWTRYREDSFFVLTVPMGRELELKPIGGPPLLTGMVLAVHTAPLVSAPTTTPAAMPTVPPPVTVTYVPGDILDHPSGLQLSRGLTARIIAVTNHTVVYANGRSSTIPFHRLPDAGATFPTEDGGWIYVSNSEAERRNCTHSASYRECPRGGVGAIRFDDEGRVINYELLLGDTIRNCGGGTTPWGAWISGEEVRDIGRIWQVDPTGRRPAQPIPMGDPHPGLFESFAYDLRDKSTPRFFMTQDAERGALRRFTPTNPNWADPWSILLGNGKVEFLIFTSSGTDAGSFQWTEDFEAAATTAMIYFPNTEGIDVVGNELMFVSKKRKSLFILDLDRGTYHNITTKSGLFNGQPDQLERIFEVQSQKNQLTYFTEEASVAGIHARTPDGKFMTILESVNHSDETTGLSFSPNGKFMYFAYQEEGVLFEVKREDGLPFNAEVLDVRYHTVK